MSVSTAEGFGVLIKRIPTTIDETDGVQTYDLDNLYPQRMEEIVARSGTATNAVNALASFTAGQGWSNDGLNKQKINRKGLNMLQALLFSSQDWALGNACAAHVSYNANYEIHAITPLFQKYCRLGIPDEHGNVSKVMYSNNWEDDTDKTRSGEKIIVEYDIFDPRPDVVKAQMEECEGIFNYRGQILYYTPLPLIYPKAPYDSVLDDIQAEAEIKLYNLRTIQNEFSSKFIFVYPGEPDTNKEKNDIKNSVTEMSGAENAGNTMVVFDPHPEVQKNLVQPIAHPNTDALYSEFAKGSKENIVEGMNIPKPIVGINPDSGIFNEQDMEQAFKIYNQFTVTDRKHLENFYSMLLDPKHFKRFSVSGELKIVKLEFHGGDPDFIEEIKVDVDPDQKEKEAQANLRGSVGGVDGILKIQQSFAENKTTEASALAILETVYGYTNEQARRLLGNPEKTEQNVSNQ